MEAATARRGVTLRYFDGHPHWRKAYERVAAHAVPTQLPRVGHLGRQTHVGSVLAGVWAARVRLTTSGTGGKGLVSEFEPSKDAKSIRTSDAEPSRTGRTWRFIRENLSITLTVVGLLVYTSLSWWWTQVARPPRCRSTRRMVRSGSGD